MEPVAHEKFRITANKKHALIAYRTILISSVLLVIFFVAYTNRAVIRESVIPHLYQHFYGQQLNRATDTSVAYTNSLGLIHNKVSGGHCVRSYASDIRVSIQCSKTYFLSSASLDRTKIDKISVPIASMRSRLVADGWDVKLFEDTHSASDVNILTEPSDRYVLMEAKKMVSDFYCSVGLSRTADTISNTYHFNATTYCFRTHNFIGSPV